MWNQQKIGKEKIAIGRQPGSPGDWKTRKLAHEEPIHCKKNAMNSFLKLKIIFLVGSI